MPLSVGKDSLTQIMSGCGFPKVFAETIRSNNGAFACFLEHNKVNDIVSPAFLCELFPFSQGPIIFYCTQLVQEIADNLVEQLL